MTEKIHIIGIGDDGPEGMTSSARQLIANAELLVGTPPALRMIGDSPARRIEAGGDLDSVVTQVAAAKEERIVVLASGDPLFFGVARYLCERLGKDRFEVVPNVSSMQLAFARVKESWDEAYLCNVATQPLEAIIEKIRTAEKAGLFTSDDGSPSRIAQALLDRRIDYFSAYVCENLGSPDERVTTGELAEIVPRNPYVAPMSWRQLREHYRLYREFAAVDVRLNPAHLGDGATVDAAVAVDDLAPASPVEEPAGEEPGAPESEPEASPDGAASLWSDATPEVQEEDESIAPISPEAEDDQGEGTCRWCRAELPAHEHLNFCPFCGTDVHLVPCPGCGEEIQPDWRFCVACGTEVRS